MKETIIGVIALAIGSLLLVFFRNFARFAIEHQNRFWGFNFGSREVKFTEIISVIVAVAFIVVGLLSVLLNIQFR